jgi:hypothetical protein
LLIKIIRRAKELRKKGQEIYASKALDNFLINDYSIDDFSNYSVLDQFASLDDSDIISSVKMWMNDNDPILADLSRRLLNRKLFKIILQNKSFDKDFVRSKRDQVAKSMSVGDGDLDYYFYQGTISNSAYDYEMDKINILYRDGRKCDITEATDTLNIKSLAREVEKHYLCFPSH